MASPRSLNRTSCLSTHENIMYHRTYNHSLFVYAYYSAWTRQRRFDCVKHVAFVLERMLVNRRIHTSRRDETGRFLLVGVSRVSSRRLVCGISKTSFCSSAVVFVVFCGVIKHVWYYLVLSRRLVCGCYLKKTADH